jgi:hypothetical protein
LVPFGPHALGTTHDRGRHEARVFASALGITSSDWRYLHDQILAALADGEVRSTRITSHGPNGRTVPVVTTWMLAGDAAPRLTSTWVDIP